MPSYLLALYVVILIATTYTSEHSEKTTSITTKTITTTTNYYQMKSLVEGVLNIVKTEGLGGLFVGYYATLVRDLPYTVR